MKNVLVFILILSLIFTSACNSRIAEIPEIPSSEDIEYTLYNIPLEPYSDISELTAGTTFNYIMIPKKDFSPEDIYTYSFDKVFFEDSDDIRKEVIEAGKNPGLGVKSLHERGITGKGVNVAIIDQALITDHPEYSDNIAAYYPGEQASENNSGSMHGSAVTSFLAGKTCGVAPEANVYFAAHAIGNDAESYANALYWILEKNSELPKDEKIRVVSVSACPEEGYMENSELWDEAVSAAQAEGILVLDCRTDNSSTGFIHSAYYDPKNPEDITTCNPMYPNDEDNYILKNRPTKYIYAPSCYRTSARAYDTNEYFYGYDGIGGQSWSVPYVAGVLALGWQINPDLSASEMKKLLFSSCYLKDHLYRMVDPIAFVEAVENTL